MRDGQQLNAITTLANDLNLIPSIYVWQLTDACNFSFRDSDTLFWPPWPTACSVHTQPRYTYLKEIQSLRQLKRYLYPCIWEDALRGDCRENLVLQAWFAFHLICDPGPIPELPFPFFILNTGQQLSSPASCLFLPLFCFLQMRKYF